MRPRQIEVSEIIAATPVEIYAILSDYQVNHPAILPKPYFSELVVTQGGQGAGTQVEVHMDVFGVKRTLHMQVSEPEPGRVLMETDADAGVVTTFTIDPVGDGSHSQVTIATTSRTSPGLPGFVEKFFQPAIIRRIYQEELDLLADYVSHGL